MLHRDVERKCSLLSRFIVDNLRDYSDKVRENLSIYLNTAEKIRLKITRNSLTLTDRTIWHNKIERIPISLIKECEVDHLSPKICYFANETVSHKYQIIVILCKTADDSYRLVNLLRHKVNTQGYYKAHSQWLQKGSFSTQDQQQTPKAKHRAVASVEIVSSPKQSKKYVWGGEHRRSPSQSHTPKSARSGYRDSFTLNSEDQSHEYINLNNFTRISKSPNYSHSNRRVSIGSNLVHRTGISSNQDLEFSSDQSREASSSPRHCKARKAELTETSTNGGLDYSTPGSTLSTVAYGQKTDKNDIMGSVEQPVVMRKARCPPRQPDYARGLSTRSAMRSSVVQYDSDTECNENTEHLQHNSNGIARVVVGGNDEDGASSSSTDHKQGDGEVFPAKQGASPVSTDEQLPEPDRQCGDGATTADELANKIVDKFTEHPVDLHVDNVIENSVETTVENIAEYSGNTTVDNTANNTAINTANNTMDNSIDGVYDNFQCLKNTCIESDSKILDSVGEMLKSFELTENIGEMKATSQHEETDEEEYQLVLTGLKQLPGSNSKADGIVAEQRYPHQIVAAMSTSQISYLDDGEVVTKSNTAPTVAPPKNISKRNSMPASSPVIRSQAVLTEKSVPKHSRQKSEKVVERKSRPQSVSSGLHLVRTNNELRRSVRRKGQYNSIAEYEKVQSQTTDKSLPEDSIQPRKVETLKVEKNAVTGVNNMSPQSPRSRRRPRMPSPASKVNPLMPNLPGGQPIKMVLAGGNIISNDQLRKHHSSRRSMVQESDINSRRASVISVTSAPNNVILRRVNGNFGDSGPISAERKVIAERKSRSFDGQVPPLSVYKQSEDYVSQNGLTLVGNQNSIISRSRSNIATDSRILQHNKSNGQLSLGEPSVFKVPILDAKKVRAHSQSRPATKKATLQWTPLPELKKKSKIQYISLPNTPDRQFYCNQPVNLIPTNWNETTWDQKPGFKRFFDSIRTYGPNGSKCQSKQVSSRSRVHSNQPDIVLESLTPDHSTGADDSDTDSSIRSSASAYWPPELKQQSNCDFDFEETASWQFHNPLAKSKHFINVP